MTTSPVLGVPYLVSQQGQPDVTHNEALAMLQIILSGGAWSIGLNTPPSSPVEGDIYVIGSSPTGAWAGKANAITGWFLDQWIFVPGNDSNGTPLTMGEPQVGLMIYSKADLDYFIWTDTGSPSSLAWTASGLGGVVGISTVKDEGVSTVTSALTLDFVGAGVTVTDAGGGEATVTIPGGIDGVDVSDGGSPTVAPTSTTIDFTGAGVSVASGGSGIATVTIPGGGGGISGIEVGDGGSPQTKSDATALDFVGAGVTVADSGGGLATMTFDAPYDLGFFFAGLPTASQEILRLRAVRAFTIPDGAPGSTANARVESTGSAVFSVRRNGVQFATVTWSAGSPTETNGTWAFDVAADETFAVNDIFTVVAPSSADATLEDIGFMVKGSRD